MCVRAAGVRESVCVSVCVRAQSYKYMYGYRDVYHYIYISCCYCFVVVFVIYFGLRARHIIRTCCFMRMFRHVLTYRCVMNVDYYLLFVSPLSLGLILLAEDNKSSKRQRVSLSLFSIKLSILHTNSRP